MCAIMNYHHLCIASLILSSCPRFEMCSRVAELLVPKLPFDPVTTEFDSAPIAGQW